MSSVVLHFCAIVLSVARLEAAPVTALVYAPDGNSLVSGSARTVEVRSPMDGGVQRTIACDLPKVTGLAFASDGSMLAIGGGEPGVIGEALLWSWPEGRPLQRVKGHLDVVTGVAFDRNGGRLAMASHDQVASVWQLSGTAAPTNVFRLVGHAGPVLAIAFSPSGETLVTAGADRAVKVWSAIDGRLIRSFNHHTESIHALAFRPGHQNSGQPVTCATGGDDRTVRIWQPEIGRMVRIVRAHEGSIQALAWSPDASSVYSAGREGIVRRIDGASDRIVGEWRAHDDWIHALAVSSDGAAVASGDWSGRVRVERVGPTGPPGSN